MRLLIRQTRRGFSLLEMVLALAIGMALLLALYVAFNTYIISSQSGRDIVAEATLARNILTRVGNDISGQLGPKDPRVADYTGNTSTTPSTTTPSTKTPATKTPATTTPSTTTPMSGTPTYDTSNMVNFNGGVFGTGTVLYLSGYRVRKGPANALTNVPDPVITSDLTRTYYWMVTNGSDTAGLARAEISQATSADIDSDPTALPDQNKYIIAPEVKTILFEYFDGAAWVPSWDGTVTAFDGSPPTGPPAAIRITITLRRNLNKAAGDDPSLDGPTYIHTVALNASNSFPAQQTTNP